MASFTHTVNVTAPGVASSTTNVYTATLQESLTEVAVKNTTTQMNIALDVSAIKAILITSDAAVTLKTNSSGSPDDTIALKAGIPYIWTPDSYAALLLTVDVVSLFFTNASSTLDANVTIIAVIDPTP